MNHEIAVVLPLLVAAMVACFFQRLPIGGITHSVYGQRLPVAAAPVPLLRLLTTAAQ